MNARRTAGAGRNSKGSGLGSSGEVRARVWVSTLTIQSGSLPAWTLVLKWVARAEGDKLWSNQMAPARPIRADSMRLDLQFDLIVKPHPIHTFRP